MKIFWTPVNSEGHRYLENELIPICEDKIERSLVKDPKNGELIEYHITDEDYYRVRAYIKKRDNLD